MGSVGEINLLYLFGNDYTLNIKIEVYLCYAGADAVCKLEVNQQVDGAYLPYYLSIV